MFEKLSCRRIICCVSLIICCLTQAASAQAPQAARPVAAPSGVFKIAGTVVNSLNGAPLGQVRVNLTDVQRRSQVFLSMLTSENGHFEFTGLPAGKFSLTGRRRGFLSVAYDQHDQFSTAIVTGAGLSTEKLILRLPPLAAISGKVVDEAGAAVRDAQVTLYSRENGDGLNRIVAVKPATTDDEGTYEITSLEAGTYFVSAWAKPWYAVYTPRGDAPNTPPAVVDPSLDVVYPTVFCNGATDLGAAAPVSIKPGDHPQIDLHLFPVPGLRVIVRIPVGENGQPQRMIPQLMNRESNIPRFIEAQPEQISEGVFELAGVPPGRYSVLIPSGPAAVLQAAELNLQSDGQELDISRMEPFASLNIVLKLPGDAPFAPETFVALRKSEAVSRAAGYQNMAASAQVESGGKISIPAVRPGKYSLMVGSNTQRYTVTRTISQGRETTGHDIIVAPGSSQEITALVVAGVISVQGFVKRGGKPVSGAMVVLVPKDATHHPEFFRRDQSDSDGSFVLPSVIPGAYSILALEDGWDLPWAEPGALSRYLAKGQDLTVGELMQRSVVLPEAIEVQPR
ncbi:MAG: carboxypeptidase regulatory-like domain-containing protein [Candidatus Sulfotelmatobacter sp.]